jgi:regulator of cell morphogenesis and NO signaling
MARIATLDITRIEPARKYSTIFQYFDDLKEGESLIVNNDRDAKPLHYQLLAERGNIFHMEYLVQGPDVFKVKITKKRRTAD